MPPRSPGSLLSCITPRSASPSAEPVAGVGVPTTPVVPLRVARARVAAALCSGVTFAPSEVHPTMTGRVSLRRSLSCASSTRVDSALWGGNAA
ncbi:hypothetical protein AB0I81_55890 [Nonomuraea sp. NPDC050404]|uniref:hypothetical protein n=1 Tax=Nonomuraea sp. NPDC050404 TaxID=3155783 RepID=UPI00340D1D24